MFGMKPWNSSDLILRIEKKRADLNKLCARLGVSHPAVLSVSQDLDNLLSHYMKEKMKEIRFPSDGDSDGRRTDAPR